MMRMRATAALWALIAGIAIAISVLAGVEVAYAADKGGDKGSIADTSSFLPLPGMASSTSWSGIGIGVYGQWINADADFGPANIGQNGGSAGVTLSLGYQAGQFLFEVFGDYGWVLGDLKDLGINTEMAVGGRAGVIVGQNTYLYLLGAKAWADTDWKTIDGWQYGGGVQIRFPNTPTYLSFEYRHTDWDVPGIGGLDVSSDAVRAILTVKLNAPK